MRLLEYKQELVEQGYTVSSIDMHHRKFCQNLPKKIPPIHMTLPEAERNSVFGEFLIANCLEFDWDASKGAESEYRKRYGDILRGKSPEWKIFSFSVSFGEIGLDVLNEETSETAYFYFRHPPVDLVMQFNIPSLRNSEVYVYCVVIEHDGSGGEITSTRVIEEFSDVRRSIEFLPRADASQSQYIIIQELTQF